MEVRKVYRMCIIALTVLVVVAAASWSIGFVSHGWLSWLSYKVAYVALPTAAGLFFAFVVFILADGGLHIYHWLRPRND
jgi:hypothetical protein